MERWAMKRRIVGDLIYTAALTHRNAVIARKRPLGKCQPLYVEKELTERLSGEGKDLSLCICNAYSKFNGSPNWRPLSTISVSTNS